MARPRIIHLPLSRPERCNECPLLGIRPSYDVRPGEKYTLWCFLPGHEKAVSGRGSKRKDARFRCKPREWKRVVDETCGDVSIPATVYDRFQLGKYRHIFERDIRRSREGEE